MATKLVVKVLLLMQLPISNTVILGKNPGKITIWNHNTMHLILQAELQPKLQL